MIIKGVLNNLLNCVPKDIVDITYVCIGTDRSIGDSLGPMVGTILNYNNLMVYGTIESPVHALNVFEYVDKLKEEKTEYVIAIDACIGTDKGEIKFRNGSIKPGAGAGKKLPKVGDVSVIGIVESDSCFIHSCRLFTIMKMAEDIADTIIEFERIRKKQHEKKIYFSEML